MKKLISVLLLLVLMLAMSASAEFCKPEQVKNCQEYVTLRAKPDTSAREVCRVYVGEVVMASEYNMKFSHCYYNGMQGYILNQYLSPKITTWSEPNQMIIASSEGAVPLRTFPLPDAEARVSLEPGTNVTVIYHDDSYNPDAFAFVDCNGQGGFVQWRYLTTAYTMGAQ